MPNQKFLDLLEKRKAAQQVKPEILKPSEQHLTTDRFSPILLQAQNIKNQYPNYDIFSCLEQNNKRHWFLILNEGSKK